MSFFEILKTTETRLNQSNNGEQLQFEVTIFKCSSKTIFDTRILAAFCFTHGTQRPSNIDAPFKAVDVILLCKKYQQN